MNNEIEKSINTLKAHLALNVKDVESSIEFYRNMLGIEPSKVRTGYAKFDVQNPPLNLTLNEVSFDGRGALSHLGIQVATTDDVLAMRSNWKAKGLIPRDEMQTTCCYALQDKAWVSDPDGNEWEAFTVIEDDLPENTGREGVCCASVTDERRTEAESEDFSCGCESAPPLAGEGACCQTQAAKFGIEVKADAGTTSCCSIAPVE